MTYDLDPTGQNPNNLIVDELHSITEANFRDYYFIVPIKAPFFIDNFILKFINILGEETILQEGLHFNFALPFKGATRSIGKNIYGAIVLVNPNITGSVSVTYQTLGGPWIADQLLVLNTLAEKAYNLRMVLWDEVTNVQQVFPPINHNDSYEMVYGQEAVISGLDRITQAIVQGQSQPYNLIRNLTASIGDQYFTYKMIIPSYIYNRGDVIRIDISTTFIEDNSILYWEVLPLIGGITDFINTSGTIVITNNSANFIIALVNKITTDSSTFYIRIKKNSSNGPVVINSKDILINPSI